VAGHRVHRGQIVSRGNWEPILDEKTWQAVRLKLSQPRKVARGDGKGTYPIGERHTGSTGRKYLLTGGLTVCGVCGHRAVGTPHKVGKRRIPYLLCHPNGGGRGCVGIVLEKAEENVVARLFAELDNPDFLNAIAADEHGRRRDEITNTLDAIEKQRGELAALWSKPGELTFTEWQEARRGLRENEQILRRELAELPPPVMNVNIEGAREAWPEMTLDEQREFLRLFIEKITVNKARPGHPRVFDPERIEIKWRRV